MRRGIISKGFTKPVNLSLYENQLRGHLPEKLGSIFGFDFIDVSENYLTGPIPSNMCKKGVTRGLLMLQNNFTGGIPVSKLRQLHDSAEIQGEQELALRRDLHQDLEIAQPEHYRHQGHSVQLQDRSYINIASNSLSVEIPSSLGSLPSLNALNISDNQLSGRIQGTMSSLKRNLLDLSNNKLTGGIPLSLSVDAYNGSFDGNPELCSETVYGFKRCRRESGMSKVSELC
ncbi:unnamed protein product [Linum tenue]|uniref:Uncharacterized protein n=1 Tax=Linum tenue TaxID=586396 RepID=A0AAV0NTY7_9ROSI|nr:unnamed protein product [Linum tenue]